MMQELNYIRCGDYFILDIKLQEETRSIGRWGRIHREYLRESNPIRLNKVTRKRCSVNLPSIACILIFIRIL